MIIDNRYNLISEIKYTKTSHVWLAEDLKSTEDNNLVAVKILRSVDANQDGLKELFRRECESLERLNHENIIRFIDSGVILEDNTFYIVTEYFKSQNLYDLLKTRTLSEDNIVNIFLEILEGVSHAHQKNVIHRDLKPSNILVNEPLNTKIIDFGISKIIGFSYTSLDTVKDHMTVAYASPEQLLRSEVRPSSDLYSVGAVLYYLLKGEDPPENKEQIFSKIGSIDCCEEVKITLNSLLQTDHNFRPNIQQIIKNVRNLRTKKVKSTYHIVLNNNIPIDCKIKCNRIKQ